MLFFKIPCDGSYDLEMERLTKEFGLKGYAWWFLLLQLCARHYKYGTRPNFVFTSKTMCQAMVIRPKNLQKFLEKCDKLGLIQLTTSAGSAPQQTTQLRHSYDVATTQLRRGYDVATTYECHIFVPMWLNLKETGKRTSGKPREDLDVDVDKDIDPPLHLLQKSEPSFRAEVPLAKRFWDEEGVIEKVHEIFKNYPEREGTQNLNKALEILPDQIKCRKDLDDFELAVNNYKQSIIPENIGTRFVKEFFTFAKYSWREYALRKLKHQKAKIQQPDWII